MKGRIKKAGAMAIAKMFNFLKEVSEIGDMLDGGIRIDEVCLDKYKFHEECGLDDGDDTDDFLQKITYHFFKNIKWELILSNFSFLYNQCATQDARGYLILKPEITEGLELVKHKVNYKEEVLELRESLTAAQNTLEDYNDFFLKPENLAKKAAYELVQTINYQDAELEVLRADYADMDELLQISDDKLLAANAKIKLLEAKLNAKEVDEDIITDKEFEDSDWGKVFEAVGKQNLLKSTQ